MNSKLLMLFTALAVVSACQSQPISPEIEALKESNAAKTPEADSGVDSDQEIIQLQNPNEPQNIEKSGEWIIKEGLLFCDGYLTRMEGEDQCLSRVPDDWEPFKFDGQTYYVQPLSNVSQ